MSKTRDNSNARDEKLAANLRVAELVKVVRFDAQTMTIDAQPLTKTQIDGTAAEQPQLVSVPVASLCMGDFMIRPWYKAGDIGLIVVCDKEIDAALEGDVVDPKTNRNHDISDSVFIGGIAKSGKAPAGSPDNALVLAAGETYLAVMPSGIEINGSLTVNGVDMSTHTHTAPAGGGATSEPQ